MHCFVVLLSIEVVFSLLKSSLDQARLFRCLKNHNDYTRLFASSEITQTNQMSPDNEWKGEKTYDISVPRHVAFIVDGNGRWAEQRGLSRPEGHTAGANVTVEIVKAAFDMGVEVVTLYLFSTG